MQYRGMSRSHLFLIELIVVILFFSFAGAITVQVFSKAHELSQNTTALNSAVLVVQTVAEADRTKPLGSIALQQNTAYFDSDWNKSDPSGAEYILTSEVLLEQREAGTMAIYSYVVSSDDKIIYELQTKRYYSGEYTNQVSSDEVN